MSELENIPKTGTRCAIYARQSRDRDTSYSSCDAQLEICTEFAKSQGWVVVDHYADVGESSETLDRPEFQRLMEDARSTGIERVIVSSMDRLSRKLFQLHLLLENFEQLGVDLSILTFPNFGKSASDRSFFNAIAAAHEYQQDLTKERMAEAHAALKARGRRVGSIQILRLHG